MDYNIEGPSAGCGTLRKFDLIDLNALKLFGQYVRTYCTISRTQDFLARPGCPGPVCTVGSRARLQRPNPALPGEGTKSPGPEPIGTGREHTRLTIAIQLTAWLLSIASSGHLVQIAMQRHEG